ncbi:hypothetical protein D3C73_1426250 [compost metagenome]|jgi:hypothetical protein
MAEINDWLDDRIQEIINSPGFHENKAEFRDQAKILIVSGEAEGFTVAQIKEACGGDVERYLLDQQNAMTDVELQRKIDEDP